MSDGQRRGGAGGRRAAAVLCALLLAALAAGMARAEVVQKGTLRVSFSGKLSPTALPREGAAPIAVSVGGQITTTDGSAPPQLRRVLLAINRNGHLDYSGLPACELEQIQPSTNKGALEACQASLVGEGSFSANVKLGQQAPFPSEGKVLAFNGTLKGRPVLLAHVYGTDPVPTSYTLPFTIKSTKGTYGTLLQASLPQVTSDWGFVTGLELDLKRRFSAGGKAHSYLSAGCPAPKGFPGAVFPLVRASFAFANRTMTSTLNRSCKAR
ncbi:MAG TPA: hypothetical protein VH275_06355 [Solirubrobacterales bacterium]|jgi:hypothetical protein|nr:hypothetical protein [Solirubrobacterales bacterium]